MEERVHLGEKSFEDVSFAKDFSCQNMDADGIRHADGKCVTCDFCGKRFRGKFNIDRHLRTHTGEKPFQCDVCNKIFSQKGNLEHHRRIHTGEKPYECNICKKNFSEKSNLKTHMRIHTGEKPYECDICNRKFTRENNMKSHIRVHTGEKLYECNICKKVFSLKGHLEKHIRIHTGEKPYECDTCKKKFSDQSHLKRHLRIHTGEKPHECNICKRRFPRKNRLTVHMKIHTGGKSFECNICTRKFPKKSHLKTHMKIHTGEKPFQLEDVVILPSGSLIRSEDTHWVNDDEDDLLCIKEEISNDFDDDFWSDHGGESQNDSVGHLDEVRHVNHVDLSHSVYGSSHLTTDRDIGTASGGDYSLKGKTVVDVVHCRQENSSQPVKNVMDGDGIHCPIHIEKSDSQHSMCVCLKQQKQIPLGDEEAKCKEKEPFESKDFNCIGYKKVADINKEKIETGCSYAIMTDNGDPLGDDQDFDVHRVFVIETKNSGSPNVEDRKDFQYHSSDKSLGSSKKENDESLSSLDIKGEPQFL